MDNRDIFDGLELGKCGLIPPLGSRFRKSKASVKGLSIFIDAINGNDNNDGSINSPLQSLKSGIIKCRSKRVNDNDYCTLILREGDYIMSESIKLYPSDSNINIISYENENGRIIGSKKINPIWKEYKNEYRNYENINLMGDKKINAGESTSTIIYSGKTNNAKECENICNNNTLCLVYMYI